MVNVNNLIAVVSEALDACRADIEAAVVHERAAGRKRRRLVEATDALERATSDAARGLATTRDAVRSVIDGARVTQLATIHERRQQPRREIDDVSTTTSKTTSTTTTQPTLSRVRALLVRYRVKLADFVLFIYIIII